MKTLIVVDMQNDFITGSLGTKEARAIVPNVKALIKEFRDHNWPVIFTMDTHNDNYLSTQEGKLLPVCHCIKGTDGHKLLDDLKEKDDMVLTKSTFGCLKLGRLILNMFYGVNGLPDEIILVGVCTDICVISNALLLNSKKSRHIHIENLYTQYNTYTIYTV